ncbi:hypothetical protein GBA52_019267 [Prunus armeniaca]|nr:hypothetical protein GBA52_019267 [Prunus armeniaca]
MLNLQAPINCSSNSLCHSFIRDNAVACTRAPLCCTFRTGGSQTAYIIMVYGGGCSAYQSFVNVDGPPSGAVVGVKKTKLPEPGVELEWVSPGGPICKSPVDCKDLLNSKCLVDLSSVGQRRCFCNGGFKWDFINGMAMVVGGVVGIMGIVGYTKRHRLKRKAQKGLMKKQERKILSSKIR